jgi:hypothetical protein
MNIFVYGDIGGHFVPFLDSLYADAGVDSGGEIPEDVVIIQVGDLVHRGPDSDDLVAWVNEVIKKDRKRKGPPRWIQLFGNHEGHHIGGPTFGQTQHGQVMPFGVSTETEKILQRWWTSKLAHMAVAVKRDDGREVLITHAGLMRNTWEVIGSPSSVTVAARELNRQDVERAFASGYLLGMTFSLHADGTIMTPGVAWASASHEVYPSWENEPMPFDQIHGHAGVFIWANQKWIVSPSIQATTTLDRDHRFSRWEQSEDRSIICVDQALEAGAPHFPIKPLKIEGEVLVP